MSVNLEELSREYETFYEDESIEYETSSGESQIDTDPRLTDISAEFKSRDPPSISQQELKNIGLWKSSRIGSRLEENTEEEVRSRTETAFQVSAQEAVEELKQLSGVGIPVASAVLTMFDPTRYAVVDFRLLRALGAIEPELVDPRNYPEYVRFMEHFRSYGDRPQTYQFYVDKVREIARDEELTPREVDMALWTLDKKADPTG